MTRSDLDLLLEQFPIPSRKIFIYKQEFISDHYITIEKSFKDEMIKDVEYKIIENESTHIIENFDFDLFYKLLLKEELVLNAEHKWFNDINSYRTGGCDMGCWATQNPNLHSTECRKYVK